MTRTRTRVAATAAALVVAIPLLSACDDVTRGRSGSSRRGARRTTVQRPRRTETRSTCTGSAW